MAILGGAPTVLVAGGADEAGCRMAACLWDGGITVRLGAPGSDRLFDWLEPEGWEAALRGVDVVFVPSGAREREAFAEFARQAARAGVGVVVFGEGR